jgi:hypothetical protein
MAKQLVRPLPSSADYAEDFYGWCLEQAAHLRQARLEALDLESLAEEIESLGNEQPRALRSSYRILLIHLLKWRYQPERRTRGWAGSIVRERGNAADRLEGNRGLLPQRHRLFEEAYARARREAAAETWPAAA